MQYERDKNRLCCKRKKHCWELPEVNHNMSIKGSWRQNSILAHDQGLCCKSDPASTFKSAVPVLGKSEVGQ